MLKTGKNRRKGTARYKLKRFRLFDFVLGPITVSRLQLKADVWDKEVPNGKKLSPECYSYRNCYG